MGQWSGWYANRRWRRKRKHQLQREPLCRHCLNRGVIEPATEVDHIEPHKGDKHKFWHGEVQSLCESCHSRKTAAEEGRTPKPAVSVTGAPEGWE